MFFGLRSMMTADQLEVNVAGEKLCSASIAEESSLKGNKERFVRLELLAAMLLP
jgi:hypothetical protein